MKQKLTATNRYQAAEPLTVLVTLFELRGRNGLLPEFRPTVVKKLEPGRRPTSTSRSTDPWFSVGKFCESGPTLIGATSARREVFGACVPTFLTVDAWEACGLSFDSPEGVVAFFKDVEADLRNSILSPNVHTWLRRDSKIRLRLLYGPSPWGDDDACLVVSLQDEPMWVTAKVPLGDVVIETGRFLYPDEIFAPLGRHAAGDWGEQSLLDPVDNELALRLGAVVRSYYDLRSPGELWVCVTTDLGGDETRLECLS